MRGMVIVLASFIASVLWVNMASAVPATMNYQGALTDSAGLALDGLCDMTFRLFDDATAGTEVWSENQEVVLSGGVYNVQLGSVAPLTEVDFSRAYWLEVTVAKETLSPRQALTSVPYALNAGQVEWINPAALPANGLSTISNGLMTNQFVNEVFGTASIAITDNNPTGVEDSLVFADVGVAETLSVSLHLTNSDLSTVTVTLTDPGDNVYTLFDGGSGGTELDSRYPEPMATVSGDLTVWVGNNPAGIWTLKVVDAGYLNNTTDGQIVSWSVASQHVSTQAVAVTADLEVAGMVSGDGSGLTGLDWNSLTSVPAGFADGQDNMVTSVDGLSGGMITSPVGIGVSPLPYYGLSVSNSTGGGVDGNPMGAHIYGVRGVADGTEASSGNSHYGLLGTASGATYNVGVRGSARVAKATTNYGLIGYAEGAAGTNFAVHGYTYGSNTEATSYGVFGKASGLGKLWAGYFEGDVGISGRAAIGTDVDVVLGTTFKLTGSTTDNYTFFLENNDNAGSAYGLYVTTKGTTNYLTDYSHYGVITYASGAYKNYGFASSVTDYSATYNYGASISATGGTYNFGIYASVGSSTANYAGYFYGNVAYTGSLTDISDRRLKENIRPLENPLAIVDGINGVYFNMQDSPNVTEVGVIAQDVQAVLPEAVKEVDEEGHLGVSYTSLVPVLIEAVKELRAQNVAMQAQNDALKLLVCQDHPTAELCQ